MAEFCSKCGSKLKDGHQFCGKCASKSASETNRNNTSSATCSSTKSQTNMLEQYMSSKSAQRSGFFSKKRKQEKTTSCDASKKAVDSRVAINVGKITENENGELRAVRGSRLPIKVSKDFNAKQVLDAAVQKHSNHNQYFPQDAKYILLYPDHKLVNKVPGTQEQFTVVLYKRELSKPFLKLTCFCAIPWNTVDTFHNLRIVTMKNYQKAKVRK